MLVLRPRLLHQRKLRQRGVEQCGLLGDFQSAGYATVVAVIHQIQPLALVADGFFDHLPLGVQLTQCEVVGGQFSGQHQLHVLKIGGRRLEGSVGRFHVMPHASEKINLIVEGEWNRIGALRVGRKTTVFDGRHLAVQRAIAGAALTQGARIRRKLRKHVRGSHSCQRARLLQTIACRHQRLISLEQLLFVGVKCGILKDLPPRPFGNRVLGRSLLPWRLRLPRIRRWNGSGGPAVTRTDGASSGEREPGQSGRDGGSLHDAPPFCWLCEGVSGACWFGGGPATFTCWPSSSESAGLMTTWSVGETPPRTSNVVP